MTKFQLGCGYLRQDINQVRALRDEQRLRAYGNAINVYQAEAFITAYLESI